MSSPSAENTPSPPNGSSPQNDGGVPHVPEGIEWRDLVAGIKAGDDAAMEELYRLFNRGIRYYLCRQLGPQELEDKVHDNFLIVVSAIKRGDLKQPECLMGYIRTVTRRQVAGEIETRVHDRRNAELDAGYAGFVADRKNNPEQEVILAQKREITREILNELPAAKRNILTRFYIEEQPKEQIIREMGLWKEGESEEQAETRYRLLKSRAKTDFEKLGKKKLDSHADGLKALSAAVGCSR